MTFKMKSDPMFADASSQTLTGRCVVKKLSLRKGNEINTEVDPVTQTLHWKSVATQLRVMNPDLKLSLHDLFSRSYEKLAPLPIVPYHVSCTFSTCLCWGVFTLTTWAWVSGQAPLPGDNKRIEKTQINESQGEGCRQTCASLFVITWNNLAKSARHMRQP